MDILKDPMAVLSELAQIAEERYKKVDEFQKVFRKAEEYMKTCCLELSFIMVCESLETEECVTHLCLKWVPLQNKRIFVTECKTPYNIFKTSEITEVKFTRALEECPINMRLRIADLYWDKFISNITKLVVDNKVGNFISYNERQGIK